MKENQDSILHKIRPGKIILPMAIGLGVIAYLIYRDYTPGTFDGMVFSWYVLFFLVIAGLMMVIRDLGYMIRLRILAGKEITWRKAFRIIMLWEFASAITPSAIGGTSVAIYFVHKEGISIGKSTAVVMATSFLDELYFVIMFPVMFMMVNGSELFINSAIMGSEDVLPYANKYFYFAIIGFSIKLMWIFLMVYALFFNPLAIKRFFLFIFRFPWIRKWRPGVERMGDDLITSSDELKKKPFGFWIKAFLSTFFSWSARYWIVNFLLIALVFWKPNEISGYFYSLSEHLIIFAKQLVMWIMMLVMPTPGGSGFAEMIFEDYLATNIHAEGFGSVMAFVWRLLTYYPYLIIGAIVVPRWVKKISGSKTGTRTFSPPE